jgi:cytochrome c
MRADELKRFCFAVVTAASLLAGGCQGGRSDVHSVHVPGGDPGRGEGVIEDIGCGACHTIPGIDGAHGAVGPPLSFWSRRSFIAGALPNSPPNLVRWIRNAGSVEPGTAMPDLGLSEQQARDVAAYLYTLD